MRPENWIDPFAKASEQPPQTLGSFLRWALKGALKPIAFGSAVSIAAGVIEVLSALILGRIIDAALDTPVDSFFGSNTGLLVACALLFIVVRPLVLGVSGVMQSVVVAPAVLNLVMSRLYRHTMGQAVTFFDDDFAGRIATKQGQAARSITDLVVELMHTVLFALASVVGSVMLMFTIDGRTAVMLLAWIAVYAILLRFFIPRVRQASKKRAGARAMVTGQIVDTVTNVKTVKLFAHDDHEDREAINAMGEMQRVSVAFGYVSASFRFCLMTLAGVLPVLMVGATLVFWTQGTASAGDIAVAGSIGLRLAQMTGWVSFTLMGMYANVGEVEDAMQTLAPSHKLVDADHAKPLELTKGEIVLDDLTFAYGGKTGGLFDVSLTIGGGEKLGIVGASGAGKSTLVALLLRLYDPETGSILLDGQDIRDVKQESLRRRIGMVTQETAMFNRSARDNILYGDPSANEDQMIAAAKRSEAHDFIQDLADFKGRTGYDAHLGERGVKLSGGQRQRIAIARAILKDVPILVLDEATSALDSEVEAAIQTALETVMDGKTVIAIAHRLSTLAHMDRIVVLDAGRIVEQGTHADLLAHNGLYANFWNRQSGGFINVKDAAE